MAIIDLNCDFGEGYGNYRLGDPEILDYVTSANIACGFHGGDPVELLRVTELCAQKGVAMGAHPGYPDLMGFGRRSMNLSPEEVKAYVIYQISALQGFVKRTGAALRHVKPHGAMYLDGVKNETLARQIAEAVAEVDDRLILVGMGALVEAAKSVGLPYAVEAFADRNYNADGTLVSRREPHAMITDAAHSVSRMCRLVKNKKIEAYDGTMLVLSADTICLHGDQRAAVQFAKELREAFQREGITVSALKKDSGNEGK